MIPWHPFLERRTQAFVDDLKATGSPPVYMLTPEAARAAMIEIQAATGRKPQALIEDTIFPVGPTGVVRIRIVRPVDAGGALPVVFHLHGGGWMLGGIDTHDRLTRELCIGARVAVVFVDY